jgi:hypothetical protein
MALLSQSAGPGGLAVTSQGGGQTAMSASQWPKGHHAYRLIISVLSKWPLADRTLQ